MDSLRTVLLWEGLRYPVRGAHNFLWMTGCAGLDEPGGFVGRSLLVKLGSAFRRCVCSSVGDGSMSVCATDDTDSSPPRRPVTRGYNR